MNDIKWLGMFKVLEECGELSQVLGKLGVKPSGDHWSGNLSDMLHDEIADVYAALDYFVAQNGLDDDRIQLRRGVKYITFNQWVLSGVHAEEGTG